MAEQAFKLSATARAMLTLAATREDRLVRPPQLPVAAARQVVRSLLNHGFVEEVPASIDHPADAWRTTEDGAALVLRATNEGMAAIGEAVDAPAPLSDFDTCFQNMVSRLTGDESGECCGIVSGLLNERLQSGNPIYALSERQPRKEGLFQCLARISHKSQVHRGSD